MKTKILVLVLLLILCTSAYPVCAEEVPPLPHAFYGTVKDINGNGAPVGAVVQAFVGGIERGSITVTDAGKYGSENPGGAKLLVQGDIEDGSEITFYIKGVPAKETATFESGEVTLLDLTASAAFPSNGGGDNGGDDDVGGGGGSSYIRPTENETAEAGGEGIKPTPENETAEAGGEGIEPTPEKETPEADGEGIDEPIPEKKSRLPGFGIFTGLSALFVAVQILRKVK